MYSLACQSENYQSLPVSFNGVWLLRGTNSYPLKRFDIDKTNPFNSFGRRIYAVAGALTAAPLGALYHTAQVINHRFFSSSPQSTKEFGVLEEAQRQELHKKAWQHLEAASIDFKAFMQGIFLTALAVSAAVAVFFVFLPLPLEIELTLSILAGGVTLLSLFDHIASPDNEVKQLPEYLPPFIANQIIGIYKLKKLKFDLVPEVKMDELVQEYSDFQKDMSKSNNQVAKKEAQVEEAKKLNKRIADTNEYLTHEMGKIDRLSEALGRMLKLKPLNLWSLMEEDQKNECLPLLDLYIESLYQLKKIYGSPGTCLSFQIIKSHCESLKTLQRSYQFLSLPDKKTEVPVHTSQPELVEEAQPDVQLTKEKKGKDKKNDRKKEVKKNDKKGEAKKKSEESKIDEKGKNKVNLDAVEEKKSNVLDREIYGLDEKLKRRIIKFEELVEWLKDKIKAIGNDEIEELAKLEGIEQTHMLEEVELLKKFFEKERKSDS